MTRVVMLPAQTNPYQTLLMDALRAQGVRVRLAQGPRRRSVAPLTLAWLRAGMPRVLHLHWTSRYLAPVLGRRGLAARRTLWEVRLLKRLGVRIIWTLHNLGDHEGRKGNREMLFHRRLVELADGVICHCPEARRLAIDVYQLPPDTHARLQVIAHGNYAGVYPDTLDRIGARTELGIDADARVFLFIGQVRRYKGVEELVATFQGIPDPDARLVVAGKPNRKATRTAIEQVAAQDDRVLLALDTIPDDRMQVYLRAADAAVLPFRDVLTSGSAILAMTFGLPVIAPAIGCLPDTLGDGALLYDPGAPDGLRDALHSAMTIDLGDLGAHAAARAAMLDWGPIAAATARLYQRPRPG